MKDFERQVLTNKAAVLRRALYGLAVNAREEDVSELNAIISEMSSLILSKSYQKYMGAPSYDPRLIPLLKYIGKPGSVGVTSEMTAGVLAN